VIRAAALASASAFITIAVDVNQPFAAHINVLLPESLLFYPAIGFLVEIVFHVVPLTLIVVIVGALGPKVAHGVLVWSAIVLVSLLEPIYQGLNLWTSSHYPVGFLMIITANLTWFNLLQLVVFQRSDFVSMYAIRLVYYVIWHIAWGTVRLPLLFGHA
jgi:hypothetical protein